VPGQVDSTNGGYDPYAPQNYTGAYAPSFAGGYNGEQVLSSGGGYNPSNPSAYLTGTDSIGGQAAVTDQGVISPDYNKVQPGGYDPANPDADTYTAGGYDPSKDAGTYDSADARKNKLGDAAGGGTSTSKKEPAIAFQTQTGAADTSGASDDWRVRISLADLSTIFYKESGPNPNSLMAPLKDTNGVIFPYTPSITVTHAANYTPATPTHSNYPMQFYNNSEVQDITISGEFTVQGIDEGKYLLAAIYFFRSATKMFFGSGANAGNPPPLVFLDGYGSHYFPHVPCVISAFTHTLPNEVDYLEIPVTTATLTETLVTPDTPMGVVNTLDNDGMKHVPNFGSKKATAETKQTSYKSVTSTTRVPATSTISITLKPVYSRKNLHDRFNLDAFAAGRLLQDKDLGYGGFL
jgi:hypothetical protein